MNSDENKHSVTAILVLSDSLVSSQEAGSSRVTAGQSATREASAPFAKCSQCMCVGGCSLMAD